MRSLVVLLAACLAVVLGVIGLAAALLPEAPVGGSAGQEAAGGAGQPGEPASPSAPPTRPGGTLEISGARSGSVELEETFSQDGRFQLGDNDTTLRFGADEGGTVIIDQAIYDGVNLFLDPGDCVFDERSHSLETGLARLGMTCEEITDVHDEAVLTISGTIDVPILVGLGGEYPTGGTMTVEGDMSAELTIPGAFWYVYPDPEECPGCMPQPNLADSSTLTAPDGEGRAWSLEFEDQTDGPTPARLVIRPEEGGEVISVLEPSGGCAVTATILGKVAPDTELLEVEADCPALTDGEMTVSVSASARVYRVTAFFGQ